MVTPPGFTVHVFYSNRMFGVAFPSVFQSRVVVVFVVDVAARAAAADVVALSTRIV